MSQGYNLFPKVCLVAYSFCRMLTGWYRSQSFHWSNTSENHWANKTLLQGFSSAFIKHMYIVAIRRGLPNLIHQMTFAVDHPKKDEVLPRMYLRRYWSAPSWIRGDPIISRASLVLFPLISFPYISLPWSPSDFMGQSLPSHGAFLQWLPKPWHFTS